MLIVKPVINKLVRYSKLQYRLYCEALVQVSSFVPFGHLFYEHFWAEDCYEHNKNELLIKFRYFIYSVVKLTIKIAPTILIILLHNCQTYYYCYYYPYPNDLAVKIVDFGSVFVRQEVRILLAVKLTVVFQDLRSSVKNKAITRTITSSPSYRNTSTVPSLLLYYN